MPPQRSLRQTDYPALEQSQILAAGGSSWQTLDHPHFTKGFSLSECHENHLSTALIDRDLNTALYDTISLFASATLSKDTETRCKLLRFH